MDLPFIAVAFALGFLSRQIGLPDSRSEEERRVWTFLSSTYGLRGK